MIRTRFKMGNRQVFVFVLDPENLAKIQAGEIVMAQTNDVVTDLPFPFVVGVAYTPDESNVTRQMLTGTKLLDALKNARDLPPTIEGEHSEEQKG